MRDRAITHTAARDDLGLPEAFASGDPDAVRAVYRRYGRLMYSVAFKVLGDSGLAEDATQQAFLQAWRAADSYDPSRALGAWLATITRRAAIDLYRRERRHQGLDDIASYETTLAAASYSSEEVHNVWAVRQALENLPAQEREVIRLQHFADLTHLEIAAQLAIPVGTVKSRSFRAHRRLAGLLGQFRNGFGDGTVLPINRMGPR